MSNLDCPICDIETELREDGDYWCPQCYRVWFETGHPEAPLASRPRRVRIKKNPEKGDHINDIIEPDGRNN